jgi:hypothetical protein
MAYIASDWNTDGITTGTSMAVPTPAGTSNGDTIFFHVECDSAVSGSLAASDGQTVVVSPVTGESDGFGSPAYSVWKATHDGVKATYTFTYSSSATRGVHITSHSFGGSVSTPNSSTSTETASSGAKNGPTINAASATVLAFFGGSAVAQTITWSGSGLTFTERAEREYYGIQGLADSSGGASGYPIATPTGSTQAVWIMLYTASGGATGTILFPHRMS